MMEMARLMLKEKDSFNTFLSKVIYTIIYILNKHPIKIVQDNMLIEPWSRQKSSINTI